MFLISKILLNSLFGRMGMCPFLPESKFIKKENYWKNVELKIFDDLFINKIEYENHYLITIPHTNDESFGLDGNVAIALAVTAYSRIEMSKVKNNPNITIYYSDTDSIYISEYLPNHLVDKKILGKWKFEGEYIYAIFLAPKTYGCLDLNGKHFTKIKGFSSQVTMEDLETILNTNRTDVNKLNQEKWFKDVTGGKIVIKSSPYQLCITDNKRVLIHNEDGILVNTENKHLSINSIDKSKKQ